MRLIRVSLVVSSVEIVIVFVFFLLEAHNAISDDVPAASGFFELFDRQKEQLDCAERIRAGLVGLLGQSNVLAFELLVQRASVVSEELHIVKAAKQVTALLDEEILIVGQFLARQVEQVAKVIPRVEGKPRDSHAVANEVTFAKNSLKILNPDSIVCVLLEVDTSRLENLDSFWGGLILRLVKVKVELPSHRAFNLLPLVDQSESKLDGLQLGDVLPDLFVE